ncbi:MAG TPA: CAP domain-containing protein [Vicinamibacterales bacterium]|nr:CAP domain-containing protein [Vicinamibacterales bacterium]
MRTFAHASSLSRLTSFGVALATLVVSAACAAAPTAPTEAGTTYSTGSANLDASVSFCTDEINRYRTRAGLAPVERAPDLEVFAARAAESDGRSGVPHQYFRMTNGGGVARAENQLLLWKGYAVNDVIRQGLAQMWAEGPEGTHFQILTGGYAQVGCGIFMNGSVVNISQDFR